MFLAINQASAVALFSGLIIPNDFLPQALQTVARALPFQQIYYMPVVEGSRPREDDERPPIGWSL